MLPTFKDEKRTNALQSQSPLFTDEALRSRYETYLFCADDGTGGDVTNNGQPLKTFDEWRCS